MSYERYLGDGVYASFDGFSINLAVGVPNHKHHAVALDVDVMEALMNYKKETDEIANKILNQQFGDDKKTKSQKCSGCGYIYLFSGHEQRSNCPLCLEKLPDAVDYVESKDNGLHAEVIAVDDLIHPLGKDSLQAIERDILISDVIEVLETIENDDKCIPEWLMEKIATSTILLKSLL